MENRDREVAASKQRKDVFARVSSIPMLVQMHEEVSVALLGILAGAMLAAVSLLGVWQGLEPAAVTAAFADYSARANAVLMPMSLITVFTVTITAAAMWYFSAVNRGWFYAATVLSVLVLAMHPLYFAHAAATVEATAADAAARVPEVMSSWANWQWLRFALSVVALIAGIRGLRAADLDVLAARSERRFGMGMRERDPMRPSHPRPAMR